VGVYICIYIYLYIWRERGEDSYNYRWKKSAAHNAVKAMAAVDYSFVKTTPSIDINIDSYRCIAIDEMDLVIDARTKERNRRPTMRSRRWLRVSTYK